MKAEKEKAKAEEAIESAGLKAREMAISKKVAKLEGREGGDGWDCFFYYLISICGVLVPR